jgi:hypothetical protein
VNCSVPLTDMLGFAGVTVIDVRLLGVFVWELDDEPSMWAPPQPATAATSREEARKRIRARE